MWARWSIEVLAINALLVARRNATVVAHLFKAWLVLGTAAAVGAALLAAAVESFLP